MQLGFHLDKSALLFFYGLDHHDEFEGGKHFNWISSENNADNLQV